MSKVIRVTDYMKAKHPEEYAEKFNDKEVVQEVKEEIKRRKIEVPPVIEKTDEPKNEEPKVEESKKKKRSRRTIQ